MGYPNSSDPPLPAVAPLRQTARHDRDRTIGRPDRPRTGKVAHSGGARHRLRELPRRRRPRDPTALLPSLLTSTLGAPAAALGAIEGMSDALAGAARCADLHGKLTGELTSH